MNDMLSQAEIDALLSGNTESSDSQNDQDVQNEGLLTSEEIDALGEIGNISMGTSATPHSLWSKSIYNHTDS